MSIKKYFVNTNEFLKLEKPEYIYILGYIWADGHISRTNNSIELYTSSKDFENLEKIISKTGNWGITKRNRLLKKTNKCYINYTFHVSDNELHDFLKNLDFDKKSYISPDKILNLISDKLKHHFYRGYSDGEIVAIILNYI